MADTIDINDGLSHRVSEVICVMCWWRWIAVRPVTTLLKDLECPGCHNQGYVIETGEILPNHEEGVTPAPSGARRFL